MPRFKATIKMKNPYTVEYAVEPTRDIVLEALADEILSGQIDHLFEIIVEKVKNKHE